MASLNLAEKAMIYNYILTTNQVVLVLEDVIEGKELVEQQCKILRKGAEILLRIVEGATLVERKEFKNGLSPTIEGLSIYGHALSTIKKLDLIKEVKGFTEFFEKLHGEMVKLAEQRKKDEIDVSFLKRFFHALGTFFRGDIQKESYPREKTLPLSRSQMNEYIFA